MSAWTHPLCEECYDELEPGRDPVRSPSGEEVSCCRCGTPTGEEANCRKTLEILKEADEVLAGTQRLLRQWKEAFARQEQQLEAANRQVNFWRNAYEYERQQATPPRDDIKVVVRKFLLR